ncbi:MAG: bifunctional folylpolyglutamate synthase/dihydrofolate synthase [Balneolaceae bacterium]|nr:MAG: bifunctional folylpolyglutamate synthase/dihydrofolate synthase [Balneolaceae bacterium]
MSRNMPNTSTDNLSFVSPEDVNRYLDSLPSFQVHGAVAARLGLDRIREFCAIMGNPQDKVPCIHVAGTNGKGSVSALLALVYEQAGYRCGLYSSPHLEHVTERIRINRQPIPEEDFLRFFQKYGDELQRADLSYFEITTAAAFWWFADQKADIVILETGLGGRLDATNVVTPQLSVITSIAHDHQNFLGRTLAEIAREKGGIIKPGRPLVLGKVPQQAQKMLVEMAGTCGTDVHEVRVLNPRHHYRKRDGRPESVFRIREDGLTRNIVSDLMAPVHRWNIAMTWLAVRLLESVFPVSDKVFLHAFENAAASGLFRARFERLHPRLPWYFDGAHNPEAVKELLQTIRRQDWDHPPVMVLSLMKDKAQKKMLQPFSVVAKNYYYRLEMERAADIALITPYLANIRSLPPNEDEITEIFAGLTKQVVIFTGSFYFYGVVKRWILRIIKAD